MVANKLIATGAMALLALSSGAIAATGADEYCQTNCDVLAQAYLEKLSVEAHHWGHGNDGN